MRPTDRSSLLIPHAAQWQCALLWQTTLVAVLTCPFGVYTMASAHSNLVVVVARQVKKNNYETH
jgi:hypothetical protein